MDVIVVAAVIGGIVMAVVVAVVVAAIVVQRATRSRDQRLRALARRQGWRFAARDTEVARRWSGSPFTVGGSAQPLLSGIHRGRPFHVFEYHSMIPIQPGAVPALAPNPVSVWAMELPAAVPALSVGTEGTVVGGVADYVGADRVDTGDLAFDQAVTVRSDDTAFGRAFLAPDVVAVLKGIGPWSWRLTGSTMISVLDKPLALDDICPRLDRMAEVLDRVPPPVWHGPQGTAGVNR